MSLTSDLLDLVYPTNCAACGRRLQKHEEVLCLFCEYDLPQTDFHCDKDNPVAKVFWGRVMLHSAAAFYMFSKGGRVQKLIHQLKYKGWQEVGVKVGALYGAKLKNAADFAGVNLILPVPLHPTKQQKRGFNQSDCFAKGLSQGMGVIWRNDVLLRHTFTETQTRKNRFDRWENVERIFTVTQKNILENKLEHDDLIISIHNIYYTTRCS